MKKLKIEWHRFWSNYHLIKGELLMNRGHLDLARAEIFKTRDHIVKRKKLQGDTSPTILPSTGRVDSWDA
jgi:hypothetical protein